MESVEKKFRQLPYELQKEVNDFIDFLLKKKRRRTGKKPTLKWIGGLREYRGQYTSTELQEKALNWRD